MSLRTIICSLLLCVLFHLCCQDPAMRLTAAAPTNMVLTATDITEENVMKRDVSSSSQNQNEGLRSHVEQAIEKSLSTLNITVNRDLLATRLTQELIARGFNHTYPVRCKRRSKAYLTKMFLHNNSPCLSLQDVSIGEDTSLTVVSGNNSCENREFHTICLDTTDQFKPKPLCSSTTSFVDKELSDMYFPRYAVDANCHVENTRPEQPSCNYREQRVSYYPLKRGPEGDCDEYGYEIWRRVHQNEDSRSVNAGCDCLLSIGWILDLLWQLLTVKWT